MPETPTPASFHHPPRPGYTLPVFACAAAIAALKRLRQPTTAIASVAVHLIQPEETADIAIEQSACLHPDAALAISRSDPGDNLDLTRHTPIWAYVTWGSSEQSELIQIHGGEGIGRQAERNHQAAIYAYAQRLIQHNLQAHLREGERLQVTIILPEGRALAQRTSNAAFGVVEGLSLLGTSGISQPLSAPGQLAQYRQELQRKAAQYDTLVFCLGENGLDLAVKLGVDPDQRIKTANWLGPLLVEAGLQGVQSLILFGYHGKLLKLAGGIFHTHHHLADGRREILTAHSANAGLPHADVQQIFAAATAEAALQHLRHCQQQTGAPWVNRIYGAIAAEIDRRAAAYIQTHCDRTVAVYSVLFDRQRQIVVTSPQIATRFS
jgi:cobalt-precorrin-5B (C1)-methyltransferase